MMWPHNCEVVTNFSVFPDCVVIFHAHGNQMRPGAQSTCCTQDSEGPCLGLSSAHHPVPAQLSTHLTQ
jgi:hypothetical protein